MCPQTAHLQALTHRILLNLSASLFYLFMEIPVIKIVPRIGIVSFFKAGFLRKSKARLFTL